MVNNDNFAHDGLSIKHLFELSNACLKYGYEPIPDEGNSELPARFRLADEQHLFEVLRPKSYERKSGSHFETQGLRGVYFAENSTSVRLTRSIEMKSP